VSHQGAASGAGTAWPLRHLLGLFLLSRVWTAAWVYLGHWRRPYLSPVLGGWPGVESWLLNPWTSYDSQYYIEIARSGYRLKTAAFFPLYPLLLRLAGTDEVALAAWGVVLSNACFALALVLAYRLARLDYSEATARRAAWVLAFFPSGAVFSAVYTESLFLALLLAAFLLARRERWLAAGCLGFLASLTRNPGVLIFAALALEFAAAYRRTRRLEMLPLAGLALPLLGFALVEGYFALHFGDPLGGLTVQSSYLRSPTWPWVPLVRDVGGLFDWPPSSRALWFFTLVNLLAATLPFVWAVRYRRELRPSYAVLMLGVAAMQLCYSRDIPPHTIGALRYMSTAFPFIFLTACSVEGAGARAVRLGALALLVIGEAYALSFGAKDFLS
jgi:hypothetical protein